MSEITIKTLLKEVKFGSMNLSFHGEGKDTKFSTEEKLTQKDLIHILLNWDRLADLKEEDWFIMFSQKEDNSESAVITIHHGIDELYISLRDLASFIKEDLDLPSVIAAGLMDKSVYEDGTFYDSAALFTMEGFKICIQRVSLNDLITS